MRALDQPARHSEDQRHRHVRRVLREDARRIRHNDATVARGFEVDIVDARSIIGDELQLRPRKRKKRLVNPVGYGRNEHSRRPHGRRELIPAHGGVGRVQRHVEQFAHARFDEFGQFAGNDNFYIL